MKVTLLSLLTRLLPDQVETEQRKPDENSQSMLSLKPTEAPATNNIGQTDCVSISTNPLRNARLALSNLFTKTSESLKVLFAVKAVKAVIQPPKSEPVVVKKERVESEYIINGDIDGFINNVLDDFTASLAFSKNINDVAEAFKHIEERIGKAEFIIAIMMSVIQERKLWIRLGYPSLSKFLDDLPSVCKVSRQTFYNAAKAGKFIRLLSSPYPKSHLLYPPFDFSFTPSFLYKNYSKLQFLYRMFCKWGFHFTEEVLINFRDMTYKEFSNFMRDFEERNHEEIIRRIGYVRKHQKRKNNDELPKPPKVEIPELNGQAMEIYRRIRLGHIIGYFFNTDPVCVESVAKFLREASRRDEEVLNERFFKASDLTLKADPNTCLADQDWSELFPNSLFQTFGALEEVISRKLAPSEIKNAFAKQFKSKTELTLAQAFLINRLRYDDHDRKLFESLREYITRHEISLQHGIIEDFFISVLGVGESRYKWLLRIANGLSTITVYKEDSIRFTSEGFLEKLSYLETAEKNHRNNRRLIAYALSTLTVKRFREFARNKHDNLSREPITKRDYLRAKPFIEKLQSYQSKGMPVSIITLKSESDLKRLDSINLAFESGGEHLRVRYPGIIWEPNSQAECAITASPETGGNENERINQDENVIGPDVQQNVNNDSIAQAA